MPEQDNFSSIKTAFILCALMAVMFCARVFPIYDSVITTWHGIAGNYINFAADDAVYHMRLVHNTLAHFPHRILYDPFTNFPYGSHIHFGPLFTLIIASSALIIGLGHPSEQLINYAGAYVPVFLGILCLLPVYFIAKKLYGRNSALYAAIIFAFLPGEFLSRSSIGYADHHVAETLFSTLTLAFLIFALHNIADKKSFFRNTVLAGIFSGLYFLTWPGAFLFAATFLIYLITQLLIDYYRQRPTKYLFQIASAIFLIPIILLSPYALTNPKFEFLYLVNLSYSLTIPAILLLIWVAFSAFYSLSSFLATRKVSFTTYLATLLLFLVTIGLIIHFAFPKISSVISSGAKILFSPSKTMRTISEVAPMVISLATNKITMRNLAGNFCYVYPLIIPGFIQLIYRSITQKKPAEILLLITSIMMFIAMLEQQRFAYYFVVYAAILAGTFCCSTFNYCNKFFVRNKNKWGQTALYLVYALVGILIVAPIFSTIPAKPEQKKFGLGLSYTWYETLLWLRLHTPDPQGKIIDKNFDYANGIYQEPTPTGAKFNYPKSAYSIMSWWDSGHDITYVAHRIPNANPFQEGIIQDNNKLLGAAPFLTATSENVALNNLNALGSRYVLINNSVATQQFGAVVLWANDEEGWAEHRVIPNKFDDKKPFEINADSDKMRNSMIYRLYYLDANQMQHFRLIHESLDDPYRVDALFFTPKGHGISFTSFLVAKLTDVQKIVAKPTNPLGLLASAKSKSGAIVSANYMYLLRPPEKSIKIFEKVVGASITGKTQNATAVTATLNLISNAKRPFVYTQTTNVVNGKYEFIVPYPTEKMHGDDYDYDVVATSPYIITANGRVIAKTTVSENAVISGTKINA